MRLKDPHRPALAIDGRCALSFVAIFLPLLPLPSRVLLVVKIQTMVKLPRQAADHRLVARIGKAQSTGRQPAEMSIWRYYHNCLPHALGLNGSGNTSGSSSIDDDVRLIDLRVTL